jgi:hypothetical protein
MMCVQNAMRDTSYLGFDSNLVCLLQRQSWFLQHRTAADYMNADGLRDVAGLIPGRVGEDAVAEIQDIIGSGDGIN